MFTWLFLNRTSFYPHNVFLPSVAPSLLVFSISFFNYLQIHAAYHAADFYFLSGKREKRKRNTEKQSENFI